MLPLESIKPPLFEVEGVRAVSRGAFDLLVAAEQRRSPGPCPSARGAFRYWARVVRRHLAGRCAMRAPISLAPRRKTPPTSSDGGSLAARRPAGIWTDGISGAERRYRATRRPPGQS